MGNAATAESAPNQNKRKKSYNSLYLTFIAGLWALINIASLILTDSRSGLE